MQAIAITFATHQENHGNVQSKCHCSVEDERNHADAVNVAHAHLRKLNEKCEDTVDDRTGGSIVVKGNEWVHLELGSRQDALHHDQTDCLEDNARHLNYTFISSCYNVASVGSPY